MKEWSFNSLLWAIPIGLVAAISMLPLLSLVIGSISSQPSAGSPDLYSVANIILILTDLRFYRLLLISLVISTASTSLSLFCAFSLAWLTERTDIKLRGLVRFFAIAPFLIPASLTAIGWGILGSGDAGIINKILGLRLLEIYSYAGLIFVLALGPAGFMYLLLVPALRNADASMDEAARLSGASAWFAFRTIQLPLVWPLVLSIFLLTFVRVFEAFEVPAIIGTPGNVYVLINEIYSSLKTLSPPDYGRAYSISLIMTLLLGAVMTLQIAHSSRSRIKTVTGKGYRHSRIKLGYWQYPCLIGVLIFSLLSTILPQGSILAASFFKIFGLYIKSMITLDNYYYVLQDPVARRAVANTVIVMILGSSICVVLSTIAAYSLHSQVRWGKSFIEPIMVLTWAMPGLVFGLSVLNIFIKIPGLYGSLLALIIACVGIGLPLGLRSIVGALSQIGTDLEEASRVHGAPPMFTFRTVILPLILPAAIACWFVFATMFSRELAAAVLIYGYGSEVISVLLFGLWEQGRGGYVAVLCIIMMLMLIVLKMGEAVVQRLIGNGYGNK